MALPAAVVEYLDEHGLISRRTLVVDLRIPPGTIDSWVHRGLLVPVERGIYRAAASGESDEKSLAALLARAGPGAAAGGTCALAALEVEGYDLLERRWVTVPDPRRRCLDGVFLEVMPAALLKTVERRGVDVLRGDPAIASAASRLAPKTIRTATDDLRRRGLVELGRLHESAERHADVHAGAYALCVLFELGTFDYDGEAERDLGPALAAVGLQPLLGAQLVRAIYADFALPEASLVIERDGKQHHTLPSDLRLDAAREDVLRADGWHVEHVRAEDIAAEGLAGVAARIAALRLARMRRGLGRPPGWVPAGAGRDFRRPPGVPPRRPSRVVARRLPAWLRATPT